MKNSAIAIAAAALLCACATPLKPSIPDGYAGPTAVIKDSVSGQTANKGNFYYVAAIDGNPSDNSSIATLKNNKEKGLHLLPTRIERKVPAHPLKLELSAHVQYGAPILALVNPDYAVQGTIEFTPEADKTYIVKGELGKAYSAVWIEDAETKAVVSKKVELSASVK